MPVPHDFRPILEKTVDELEGHAPKPAHDSSLVERVAAARRVPLGDLSVEQLRLLIGQGQAVSHLAPVAMERLEGIRWPGLTAPSGMRPGPP